MQDEGKWKKQLIGDMRELPQGVAEWEKPEFECVLSEEMAQQKASQWVAALDSFTGLVYSTTKDYRIDFMNRAFVARTGYDATGEICYRALNGLDAPCPWCSNDQVFRNEMVRYELQSPLDNRWYYVIASPVVGEDGSVTKKQAIIIDITDRKRVEAALKEREKYSGREIRCCSGTMKTRYRFCDIIGKSQVMQNVYDMILKAAAIDVNVIVYGESGTGKELVSKAIHDMSERCGNNFVPVNCGAIPNHLLESEFFGYTKGAFTGAHADKSGYLEMADGGTLFMDEVGDIDLNMQVKLLRAIEGGGYTPIGARELKQTDVRIIAATNKNLVQLVDEGLMREDFFYRIHVVPIHLPPLRERKEDLVLLIENFLKDNGRSPGSFFSLPAPVMHALLDHDWPGNIRELHNVLYRYITLKKIDLLGSPRLCQRLLPSKNSCEDAAAATQTLRTLVAGLEKDVIAGALDRNCWHKGKVSVQLGIDRKTLTKKMRQYGLVKA